MEHDHTAQTQETPPRVQAALAGAGLVQVALVGAAVAGDERTSSVAKKLLVLEGLAASASFATGCVYIGSKVWQARHDQIGKSVQEPTRVPTRKKAAVRQPTRGSRLLTGISRLGSS